MDKMNNELSRLQTQLQEQILQEETLAAYTTWKVGGKAKVLIKVNSIDEIKAVLFYCYSNHLNWVVLGNGSNVLISDKGFDGVVIILNKNFSEIDFSEANVTVGGGILLPVLVKKLLDHGYVGLEFAAGIPGTLGGAITMNAGAHGKSMSHVVAWVKIVNEKGLEQTLSRDEIQFGYRTSRFKQEQSIVYEVGLKLEVGNSEPSKDLVVKYKQERKQKQPLEYPNAGSVFKNPPGQSAGQLIEASGCKGLRIGDAVVSEKHANFIINAGAATSKDILALVNKVREIVKKKFDIDLEMEVLVLGE